jgi:hypothetical protein
MYYYEKYNTSIMLLSAAISFAVAAFLLRKSISSLIDPLLLHLVWCASAIGLLSGYFSKTGVSLDGLLFVCVYVFYIAALYLFLSKDSRKIELLQKELDDKRNVRLFFLCLALNLISRYEFIIYALSSSSILEWFLYRFKQIEGRSVIQYILQLGARPFFIYYSFVLIHTKPKLRYFIAPILFVNILLDIIAGGRSSVISLLLAYGYFVHHFSPFFSKERINKLNLYGIIAVLLALVVGSFVTSFYQKDVTLQEGMKSMANRLLAAGDGLEMYLVNNGSVHIKSGLIEYTKSVFGIFIKRVIPIETQSIGWKLYELENGITVPFAVGPNYILPLQAFVLGKIYIVPYCFFIGFLTAFLRGNLFSRKYIPSQPLSFVLGLLSFEPALDIELFVLSLCGSLLVYYVFVVPMKKTRIILDYPKTRLRKIIWKKLASV